MCVWVCAIPTAFNSVACTFVTCFFNKYSVLKRDGWVSLDVCVSDVIHEWCVGVWRSVRHQRLLSTLVHRLDCSMSFYLIPEFEFLINTVGRQHNADWITVNLVAFLFLFSFLQIVVFGWLVGIALSMVLSAAYSVQLCCRLNHICIWLVYFCIELSAGTQQ